jgi:hypothetical protein
VAYVSYPKGILWRSKPDGSQKIQLSSPPLSVALPRWSPDGKQIAFFDYSVGKPVKTYLVQPKAAVPSNHCLKIPSLSGIRAGRRMGTRLFSVANRLTRIQPSVCSI